MCINLPTMYIKYKQGYGQYKPYLLTPLKKHKPTTNLQLVNSPKNLMQSFFIHIITLFTNTRRKQTTTVLSCLQLYIYTFFSLILKMTKWQILYLMETWKMNTTYIF